MKFTDPDASGYRELAATVALQLASTDEPLVFGICGAQGSGKSTFARMLSEELVSAHDETVALLSLDDFYLTREQRLTLSREVHPFLATRGVPGTHDIELMLAATNDLLRGNAVDVPVFDKAMDDRAPEKRSVGPARIILCEGWCWGAIPEPEHRLQNPVNQLEQDGDSDRRWRFWVNDRLAEYQDLFGSHQLLFFSAPSFESILDWRWRQEQDLMKSAQGDQIMTREQVAEFIAFYQRLSVWMLEEMIDRADMTVTLAPDHSISQIHHRVNSGAVQ